jgi:hypothetical protein
LRGYPLRSCADISFAEFSPRFWIEQWDCSCESCRAHGTSANRLPDLAETSRIRDGVQSRRRSRRIVTSPGQGGAINLETKFPHPR